MLKVIDNPDDITQTKNFDNALHIFNPILNPPPPRLTFNQLINHLKILYSRENILNNIDLFFSAFHCIQSESHTKEDIVKRLIKFIPDDQLWLLHFFYIQQVDTENKIRYTYHKFTDTYSNNHGFYFYLNPQYTQRGTYSYRGDNFEGEIQSLLQAYYDSHIKYNIESYGNNKLHRECSLPSYYCSVLGYKYHLYILGHAYCLNSSGDHLTADHVRLILRDDPNASLVNTSPAPTDLQFLIRSVISKQNKTPLYRMLSYSASPTALLQWPLTAKGEHNPVLYGIELELATDYTVQHLVDATDEPFFLVKQDSSVTGSKRFKYELATVPMSFKAHKKQWAYWFSNLDYDKFDTTNETNNGMHVHIGRSAFADPTHIKNFVWFFTQPAHVEFMKFFSQRDQHSFDNYAIMPHRNASHTRVRTFRNNNDAVQQNRGCVHFSPKGTLEVRLFRGIVSLADMLKNLEFVDSLFHFTMQGQNFTKLSLKAYIAWLHQQPRNKYVIIKKYLERTEKLQKLIDTSSLLDLIFNEKAPEKILQVVAKANFQVTNEHVTVLNQRWKKRIFVLNKETKKLELNRANQSSLSFLDRMLEAKILHGIKKESMPPPQPPADDDLTALINAVPVPTRRLAR